MSEIKRIESLENEFVEQLKGMLYDSFPAAISFKIDYFVGEQRGIKGLYIEIDSKPVGPVYKRRQELKSYETITDVEEPFINAVVNDLVLAGMSFIFNDTLKTKLEKNMTDTINLENFVNVVPRLLIHLN